MAGILLQNQKTSYLPFLDDLRALIVVQVSCTFDPFWQLFVHDQI